MVPWHGPFGSANVPRPSGIGKAVVPWDGRGAVPTCLDVGHRQGSGALAWARGSAIVPGRWAAVPWRGRRDVGQCQRAWTLGIGWAVMP